MLGQVLGKRETGLEPTRGKAWNGKRILSLPVPRTPDGRLADARRTAGRRSTDGWRLRPESVKVKVNKLTNESTNGSPDLRCRDVGPHQLRRHPEDIFPSIKRSFGLEWRPSRSGSSSGYYGLALWLGRSGTIWPTLRIESLRTLPLRTNAMCVPDPQNCGVR
jgi:hypothetical protein